MEGRKEEERRGGRTLKYEDFQIGDVKRKTSLQGGFSQAIKKRRVALSKSNGGNR